MTTTHFTNDIDQLNSFLRGELAAVETYTQCIAKVSEGVVVSQLRVLQSSHQRRADVLAMRVKELGGTPATSSGIWGGFAKLLEAGASTLGAKSAISTLEEGEDLGLASYKRQLSKLSPVQQRFVEVEVLPEQVRSHDILRGIEQAMKTPS